MMRGIVNNNINRTDVGCRYIDDIKVAVNIVID